MNPMHAVSPFEIVMLVCFGISWPLSIYRTWRVKSSHGKSLRFLSFILIGYISGCLHKIIYYRDPVLILYAFNGAMVAIDLFLSVRYRRMAR